MHSTQRGNILFLILLAVILFAALSYAVTQSLRGGGKDASPERAQTFAAQLLQNVSLIENTMMRAMLVNGIPDYGFDVSSEGTTSSANATCTVPACRIYADKGGGVPPFLIPDPFSTEFTSISWRKAVYLRMQVINVGTSLDELVIRHVRLTRPVCEALNAAVGAEDVNLDFNGEIYGASASYSGTLTSLPANGGAVLGNELPTLSGKRSFCFQHSTEGYSFIHVVIAR